MMDNIAVTSNYLNAYNTTQSQKSQLNTSSPAIQLNFGNESTRSASFTNIADYTKYLKENYNYLGNVASVEGIPTRVSVSASFLRKCIDDPEKAEYLESSLCAISDSASYVKSHSL